MNDNVKIYIPADKKKHPDKKVMETQTAAYPMPPAKMS